MQDTIRTTAVVTGASAGIGEAIAKALLAAGNTVIALQRSQPRTEHARLHHVAADLADADAARAAAQEIAGRFQVGMLVNNAGANRTAALLDASTEDLDHVVALNLRAALILTQAFSPGMRAARYGRIVNIASRAALGKTNRAVYSMTKAGLIGFSRTCALELGPDGITVNVVAPGPVATELFRRGHPEGSEQLRRTVASVVVGRMGTPEDIARAVAFFLAPEAGFVTGQTLYVCGGVSLGSTPM